MSLSSSARSRGFAGVLVGELAHTAEVTVAEIDSGVSVTVVPSRAGARSVSWADFGEEIVVQVGQFGGRWELGGDQEDLSFLEEVVRSVVAGRVSEVLSVRRSRVVVILADGTGAVETGYNGARGCLPLPLWPRWSRKVRYLPYR